MSVVGYVALNTSIAFLWHNLIGAVVVFVVGMIVSELTGRTSRPDQRQPAQAADGPPAPACAGRCDRCDGGVVDARRIAAATERQVRRSGPAFSRLPASYSLSSSSFPITTFQHQHFVLHDAGLVVRVRVADRVERLLRVVVAARGPGTCRRTAGRAGPAASSVPSSFSFRWKARWASWWTTTSSMGRR